MDVRAETARFGPTSHTQLSSEWDTQDSTIGLAPDQGSPACSSNISRRPSTGVGTLASRQGGDFLRTWPTLAAVQRARAATVRRFYQQHNCRRAAVIAARLEQIATAVPLTTNPAIINPLSLVVQTYATQLRSLLEAIEAFDTQIATVFAGHPDHDLFAELPRGRPGLRPAAGGRLRHRSHPLGGRPRPASARGHRARHRTQREGLLGASPPGVSEILQAEKMLDRTTQMSMPPSPMRAVTS